MLQGLNRSGGGSDAVVVENSCEWFSDTFDISNILKKKSTSEVIPSPEELVGMFFKWTDPPDSQNGFAVLPYIYGIILEKRVDAYTLEKRNTYETLKFLKVVPILPAMRGSKATLLILRMHASSTKAIHA